MKSKAALVIVVVCVMFMSSVVIAQAQDNYVTISNAAYQTEVDGKKVELYTIHNTNGMVAKITNYAGKLVQLLVPDKNGKLGDVVLGYDTLDQARNGQVSMGCIIGRYANRIGKGQFSLNGVDYQLTTNDGPNTLHGGLHGSRFVVFDASQIDDQTLQLTYYFKDGEEGFPGNCLLKVVYALTDNDELVLTYDAVTDKPTIVNFTNHAFFNLAGAGNGSILNHVLTINADYFTPADKTLIPTGELRAVQGTPLDFTTPHAIGDRITSDYDQVKLVSGYDFNFVLNKNDKEVSLAARVYEPTSGRVMEVLTTEPGIQFYSGNFLQGKAPRDVGKGGKIYNVHDAFCLETQHFPDAPNKINFPATILNPGEWFTSKTIYKFSVIK